MNDQLGLIAILGISYLLLSQGNGCTYRGEAAGELQQFKSDLYGVTFKYPASWTKNLSYVERYDGPGGFVEVAEIEAYGRPIDEVAKQETDTPIKPFGSNPKIIDLELDGRPARIIVPSADQNKVFERELAIIIENKQPIIEGQDFYDYTIIWTNKDNLETILNSFKFV